MSTTTAGEADLKHKAVMKVLSGIVICIFLAALDQTVVIPAIPAIARDLHDSRNLSWILTAYLLASTIVAPIYGRLSDTYGRRRLLEICLVIFIAASVACGLAQSITQLIFLRALQGLGGGGLMSLAQAAIADAVTPRERGRYQGYLAGVWAVASIAGPLVGGFLADHASWQWLFWINLPLGLLALRLCRRGLPAAFTARGYKTRFDTAGSLLMIATVSSLLLMLTLGGKALPWASGEMLGMGALFVAASGLLVLQQIRKADGLFPPRLFTDRALLTGTLSSTLAAGGVFASLFVLPIFYQNMFRSGATNAGLLMIPFLVANVAGNFATGHLARKMGRMKPVVVSGTLMSIAGFLLLATAAGHLPLAATIAFSALAGVGLGCAMVGTLMSVQNAARQGDIGTATGTLLLLRSVGSMLGGAAVGAYLESQLHLPGASGAMDMHGAVMPAVSVAPAAFSVMFLGIAAAMLVALLISLKSPNVLLRSGEHPVVGMD
ncbi:MDR family MFS transporter [Herbaspirillum robiniae]|nr:MDR family MFS transporter [Herbaspirillum robiniae]